MPRRSCGVDVGFFFFLKKKKRKKSKKVKHGPIDSGFQLSQSYPFEFRKARDVFLNMWVGPQVYSNGNNRAQEKKKKLRKRNLGNKPNYLVYQLPLLNYLTRLIFSIILVFLFSCHFIPLPVPEMLMEQSPPKKAGRASQATDIQKVTFFFRCQSPSIIDLRQRFSPCARNTTGF